MGQKKHWYMEWVVGDWLVDPQVSLLKESTRAIWFDALCCMFAQGSCGQLVGSVQDLARLCRTTPNGMKAAIEDLNARRAADVSEKDGIVTLTNRRMFRAYLSRVNACERKRRERRPDIGDDVVTANVTPDVTPPSYSNSNPNQKASPSSAEAASGSTGDDPPSPMASHQFPVFATVKGERCKDLTWKLSDEHIAELTASFPGVDVPTECRKAHGWVRANFTKRKTAEGMPKYLFGWICRKQNEGGSFRGRSPQSSPPPSDDQVRREKQAQAERLRERQQAEEGKANRIDTLRKLDPDELKRLHEEVAANQPTPEQAARCRKADPFGGGMLTVLIYAKLQNQHQEAV